MKILGWALIFCISLSGVAAAAPGKIQILAFDPQALPPEISYQGKLVSGAHWLDKNGENLLLLCETGYFNSPVAPGSQENPYKEPGWAAEIYGYHYVKAQGKFTLLWKMFDSIKICPYDLTLAFLPHSLTITDLDGNGVAESSFLYKRGCRGDVSPVQLKLIMHQGKEKYAIRGKTLVPTADPQRKIGGQMAIDAGFQRAPKVFLNYAVQKWQAFVAEKFDTR